MSANQELTTEIDGSKGDSQNVPLKRAATERQMESAATVDAPNKVDICYICHQQNRCLYYDTKGRCVHYGCYLFKNYQ